jgi:hypothetical protein
MRMTRAIWRKTLTWGTPRGGQSPILSVRHSPILDEARGTSKRVPGAAIGYGGAS